MRVSVDMGVVGVEPCALCKGWGRMVGGFLWGGEGSWGKQMVGLGFGEISFTGEKLGMRFDDRCTCGDSCIHLTESFM